MMRIIVSGDEVSRCMAQHLLHIGGLVLIDYLDQLSYLTRRIFINIRNEGCEDSVNAWCGSCIAVRKKPFVDLQHFRPNRLLQQLRVLECVEGLFQLPLVPRPNCIANFCEVLCGIHDDAHTKTNVNMIAPVTASVTALITCLQRSPQNS
ncbi:hypothetical protein CLU88_3273 [Acidovorax sp. 56]|nr:hypothetical protein CLU88_3273 [Acidovorax sp. 56]